MDGKSFKLASAKTGRKLGGVCAGIANSTGIDVTILRLALVLAAVFYGVGVGAYLLAWLVGALVFGYDE